jgi:glycosyltransferase involved in cell wall biosynthesis
MEAMSMMLLEAVSVKVPVICSDIKENRDLFTDDEVLFFQSENVIDLSEKIEWALKNLPKMRIKAALAYNKLSRDYTWELVSKQYSKLYNQMLERF